MNTIAIEKIIGNSDSSSATATAGRMNQTFGSTRVELRARETGTVVAWLVSIATSAE
jgi:hypothetical protein